MKKNKTEQRNAHLHKFSLATRRAVCLANEIMRDYNRPATRPRHTKITGEKELQPQTVDSVMNGTYSGNVLINLMLSQNDTMIVANCPLEFTSIHSFVNNYKEIMELTEHFKS